MNDRDVRDNAAPGTTSPSDASPPSSALSEHLYRQVLPGSGRRVAEIADSLLITPEDLLAQLEQLIAHHVVSIDDDVLNVLPPSEAIALFMRDQAKVLAEASEELKRLSRVIPALPETDASLVRPSDQIAGEVSTSGGVAGLLVGWMRQTSGDMCFMRPDQWRFPTESDMAVAVATAVGRGQRVRAIYPTRAIHEAPEVLAGRMAIGEEVRVVPEVETRLAVIGEKVLLPEPLGSDSPRRVKLFQPGLVAVVQAYFDLLWDSAIEVPPSDAKLLARRLLLGELYAGSKDEQIARNLDISLRTVRRRVAALMDELGVDSRFQLGVEAARRGWL